MPWICADCGAEYDENTPPCLECGSERFAELAAADDAEITSMADVDWACTQCGRIHQRNNPPCNDCGGMQFEAVEDIDDWGDDTDDVTATPTPSDTDSDQTTYYLGIVGGIAGLIVLPFIFWVVAIVESPLRLLGRSIQNVLPAGASTNDGVTGSFHAFAWAGHLAWALALAAFLLGALIALFL